MADQTAHDRFLRGEPLNEELARIREGKAGPAPEDPLGLRQETAAGRSDRPLNRKERVALKEMVDGDGWPLMQRLMEKVVRIKIDSATLLSQGDPLGNPAELVNEWAYVKLFRRACAEIIALTLAEIAELEKDEEQ